PMIYLLSLHERSSDLGCVLGCASLTQQGTLTIKGTVCSCTNTQVTVQEAVGKYYDIIQRTGSTIITGTCSAGQPVTVQCQSIDKDRKSTRLNSSHVSI